MTNLHRALILGSSVLALAACGPEEIASPGTGGDIIINNPGGGGTPTPGAPAPTPGTTVTAASSCPSFAATGGLIQGSVENVPNGTVLVCTLPATVDASATLIDTPDNAKVVYELAGRTDVGTDGGPSGASDVVTLTIEPGVVVFASAGNAFLVVNRGNSINAAGTTANPIVFTSDENLRGSTNDNTDRQWGGVILLGRAPIADCEDDGATGGTAACEAQIEGTPLAALYGGATANDDSGTMRNVQIRFSGFPLAPDNELQSLTTGGIGSGTTLENIMSFNSSDDGAEFFGGVVNMRNFIAVGAGDDSIDLDSGVQFNLQNTIVVQRTSTGNSILEIDSSGGADDLPRTDVRISNGTFVAQSSASDDAAFRFRSGGADIALANIVMDAQNYNQPCIDIEGDAVLQTSGPEEMGIPFFASVYLDCGSAGIYNADRAAAAEAAFNATSNNTFNSATPSDDDFDVNLQMVYVNDSTLNGLTAFDPGQFNSNGFTFQNLGYVGAANGTTTWFQGWSCDSGWADFNGSGNCADSPVG